VGHRRTAHTAHEFRYPLFFLFLDLAELDQIFAGRWFWSVERPNWASFRRADHLRSRGPLDQAVLDAVKEQLGYRPTGPVRILTHLRYLGYCFNPISIYYCYGKEGRTLEAIVTEVHNTPWGEEYIRALDPRLADSDGEWLTFLIDKEFHVSPFMPMDINYEWRFTPPGETLKVWMENRRNGVMAFRAKLELDRTPLDGMTLSRLLLKWPFMTGRVITAIYWQALRLWLKGVPFCPHPNILHVTKGMYNP
jgi:DUF1365 family protein